MTIRSLPTSIGGMMLLATVGAFVLGGPSGAQAQTPGCINGDCQCYDYVQQPNETDLNCGNQCTYYGCRCDVGEVCGINGDCRSNVCEGGICASCDSGGPDPCEQGACDPQTGHCSPSGSCDPPGPQGCINGDCECYDDELDPRETDIDCGGDCTYYGLRCNVGQQCVINDDCRSNSCDLLEGICAACTTAPDSCEQGTCSPTSGQCEPEPVPLTYACIGFEAPLDDPPVAVRRKRALPLKAQLIDAAGNLVTDAGIGAAPVLQVVFSPSSGESPTDVTTDALAVGLGTDGNQFEYASGRWRYNLKTSNYSATGSYTVSIISGDDYVINPSCETRFVIE